VKILNIEIKARSADTGKNKSWLVAQQARFVGTDHQIDTYFKVPQGRLKLRLGNIEKSLIYYQRPDQAGPKQSDVLLYPVESGHELLDVLKASLGVKVVVDKIREIYFLDNVKFHIDTVQGLGDFVEIEAIDSDGSIGRERLREQCQYYLNALDIKPSDLVEVSYSDLLMEKEQ
jgi:adenylate cyclase class 2